MAAFREYDVRGIYPSEVTDEFAEKIGKAFGTFMPEGATVAVGGDVRTSTPILKEKLIEGILSTGVNVIDIGMMPSPALYFTVVTKGLEGGAMVTASHNPKDYNGFKFVSKGCVGIMGSTGLNKMKEMMESGEFRTGEGGLERHGVEDPYIRHMLSKVSVQGKKKIVIDSANGACSLIAPKLFERLGWEVVPLFCTPDGTFPNHEADPVKKKNMVHLQERVKETGADLGVAFDGDGDRLGVVNGEGEHVENSKIFSLLIKETLQKKPDSAVVYEVLISKMVEDTIKRFGGKPILTRVGYPFIKAAIKESNAVIAGENSAHLYFDDNFSYDDALFAALKVAELLNKGTLKEREKEIPDYVSSQEYRPVCDDSRKFQAIKILQEKLKKEGYNVNDIDGARVVLDNGWFIIRASNTGPQLVLRWEAEDQDSYNKIGDLVKDQLKSVGVDFHE